MQLNSKFATQNYQDMTKKKNKQIFWEISTCYKAIPWTASKAWGQYSYQQHSRSKGCMPKAKKKSISCWPYFQGLLQKIKIYVQTVSLIFLVSYFLLELEFPKNIDELKVLLEIHL